jgi:hypothetical protein
MTMRMPALACCATLAILAGIAATGTAALADAAPVSVAFVEPETFTDIGDRDIPSPRVREAWLNELRRHIERRAASLLPAGATLAVTITDIDMAGGFEPWRRAGPDVRIVRDVYPPRIDLRFVLADAQGTVLREGERKLRDLAFLMRPTLHPTDPLRHEKALLDDWLDRELGTTHR